MKRFFMILAILMPAVLFSSCGFFGENGEGEEPEDPSILLPSLTYEEDVVLSGQDLKMTGYISEEYSDFKILFGDRPMEVTRNTDWELSVSIPETMKGEYAVSFESAGLSKELGNVQIFTYAGDVPLGTACRVDITDAHTLFSVVSFDEHMKSVATTHKWVHGDNEPREVKFFNIRDNQVYATLWYVADISSDFFTARLDNPRDVDDLEFNQNDYTCYPKENGGRVYVMIDKQTGYIFRIINSEGFNVYYQMDFQWVGDRQFVISPASSGAFLSGKLSKIDVPEIIFKEGGVDQFEDDFAPEVRAENINGQENLDIESSPSRHWIAASGGDIYLNKDRRLLNSYLSPMSLPDDYMLRANPQVFACYDKNSICIAMVKYSAGILPFFQISGNGYYYEEHGIDGSWNVYQFADKTVLSANCRNEELGKKLCDFVLADGGVTKKEFTVDEFDTDINNIITEYVSPMYPCVSNYEYYITDDLSIFRRRIDPRGDKEKVIGGNLGVEIPCMSASANAISLVAKNGEGMTLFMYDKELDLLGSMKVDMVHGNASVCRLRD